MADTKISALTSYTPPITTDVFPIVDVTTSTTKKITVANLSAYLAALSQTLTNKTMVAPVLGTPASVTLTNATGLPVSGITSSTSTALGVGSLELGAASDTTLARSSAGVMSVEGVVIPSISSTNTITNKRNTKRVVTTTQSATPTINTDNTDVAYITGLAQAVTSFTTNLSGTPSNGDTLILDITDSGTGRALTFGSSFESSGTVTLPTTTTANVKLTIGLRWNTATSKWRCDAVS